MTGDVREIPWRLIRPMPDQPRKRFDKAKLQALADSIAAKGQVVAAVVSPVEVDRLGHLYQLVDGQRRWHAVQLAGVETLRAEVVPAADAEELYVRSAVANFCREDHTPLETAKVIDRLSAARSHDEIAALLGKSQAYVYQYHTLLKLHPDLQDLLDPDLPRGQHLPVSAGIRLAQLEKHRQLEAYAEVRKSNLSPGLATRQVVDDMVHESRPATLGHNYGRKLGPRGGPRVDGFEEIHDRVMRAKSALDGIDPARLRTLADARDDESVAGLRGRLEATLGFAGALLGALTVKSEA